MIRSKDLKPKPPPKPVEVDPMEAVGELEDIGDLLDREMEAITRVASPEELLPTPATAEPDDVLVELKCVVILNGKHYGPGPAAVPAAAYDVWKHALKK